MACCWLFVSVNTVVPSARLAVRLLVTTEGRGRLLRSTSAKVKLPLSLSFEDSTIEPLTSTTLMVGPELVPVIVIVSALLLLAAAESVALRL